MMSWKKNCLLVAVFSLVLLSCNQGDKNVTTTQRDLIQYVDPFIGTGFHGHVFLGANVPFGAVQLGPTNLSTGWDWCSGYHYSDSTIIGFTHTHLSGTGIGDLGDISLMPVIGNVPVTKGVAGNPASGYYSLFSHTEENALPGYYSVYLNRYAIKAELTATKRVGFHQYTFPESREAKIIIDLETGIGWDSPVKTFIERINDTTIAGYRYSKGWAAGQQIYFTAVFSKPFKRFDIYEDTVAVPGNGHVGSKTKGVVSFANEPFENIKVKVGISPVSVENAIGNITKEIPHWKFETIAEQAAEDWNAELNKIIIETDDPARKRTFYTALYHTMIAPSVFNDHNGQYRGTDKKVYKTESFTNLTTFSLWDTYRAAHPLFTLVQQQRVNDMISSMLAIYRQQGKLPVWHLVGNETNTMPGNSAVQVVADAYVKGYRGFDTALAWEAVKNTAMQDARGMNYVKQYGYIPADSMVESVAMGLEYAIADGAIAQMAKQMGKAEDYAYFSERAKNYRHYFNAATGFMRGRVAEKQWRKPFSPFVSRHMKDDFSEGNAWQYTWLVPQDVEGLVQLLGGKEAFGKKLDSLFVVKGDMGKEASADITGLIGSYAHGNEPGHHIPYLYNYIGKPWKTADKVRYILDSLYADTHDGLCGNEDVGQMSAWYVLSAMGLYQVNPTGGVFVIGSPVIDEAVLTTGKGTFRVVAKNNSRQNKYVQRATLNGEEYTKSYLLYKDIIAGGELVLQMGAEPSASWGVTPEDCPASMIAK